MEGKPPGDPRYNLAKEMAKHFHISAGRVGHNGVVKRNKVFLIETYFN